MSARRFVSSCLGALLVCTVLASPVAAASATYDDASDDVVDGEGEPSDAPLVDILGITLQNEPTFVEVRIEVAEARAVDDAAWKNDLLLIALLGTPSSFGAAGVVVFPSPSGATALVAPGFCPASITADTTNDVYTLRASGHCARGMPRTATPLVLMSDSTGNSDVAPDDFFSAEQTSVISSGNATVGRLAGTDRILTAIELSRDRWDDDGAKAVVLASSERFSDALAGGPLAVVAGAPILLTGGSALDERTRAELIRVAAEGATVYLLGGTAALSDAVLLAVDDAGFDARRVAGVNRFATAVAVAETYDTVLQEQYGGLFGTALADSLGTNLHGGVLIADGRSFTDGLLASAAAAATNSVVLLTEGATMPPETAEYLAGDDTTHYAIGDNAHQAAPDANGVTGSSPSVLSRHVVEEVAPIVGIVAVATESKFADALAGGAHVGALGGPLLLTNGQSLSPDVRTAIVNAEEGLREVVIYGGTAAVSQQVEDAIRAALS